MRLIAGSSPLVVFGSALLNRRQLLLFSSSSFSLLLSGSTAMSTSARTTNNVVIDSHLHVWADTNQAAANYPWIQEPPDNLKDAGSTEQLIQQMDANNVDGALIVQPINHQFDHSYILNAIRRYPRRFKGMMLHDPSQSAEQAVGTLENLVRQGCVGVRFNPYLWPITDSGWEPMSQSAAGLAVYKRCGELSLPVGIMCFQGLDLHYSDILDLIEASPETNLILDHFGFCSLKKPQQFQQLLELSRYPQVHVKVSALFRLDDKSDSFERVRKERFLPLLEAYGADRLLYGSDFPFVLEQQQGYGMVNLVSNWIEDDGDRSFIMGGTSERLFGPWSGAATTESPQR